jgi:hypothetical protein
MLNAQCSSKNGHGVLKKFICTSVHSILHFLNLQTLLRCGRERV